MSRRLAGPPGIVPVTLSQYIVVASGTSAEEFVTDLDLGFHWELEKVIFSAIVVGTGAGATRTLRALKGASTVVATGALTLAGTSAKGEQSALTVTDDGETNLFRPGDLLTIDLASGGTSFSALAGNVTVIGRAIPQTLN